MNHLFAKVNDRKNKYRILLSDVTVYENIDLSNVIEFQLISLMRNNAFILIHFQKNHMEIDY